MAAFIAPHTAGSIETYIPAYKYSQIQYECISTIRIVCTRIWTMSRLCKHHYHHDSNHYYVAVIFI